MRSFSFLLLLCFSIIFIGCKKKPPIPPVVLPAPTITSLSANSGFANASITINGTNFDPTVSGNTVKFNGTAAAVTNATTTALVVTVPAGGTTGAVTVTTSTGTATGPIFTYLVLTPPTITAINPTSGTANTVVTITGTNFKTVTTDNTVKFNGVAATVQTASTTSLTVLAPATGTTGAVSVTTSDGTATGPTFTYVTTTIYISGNSVAGTGYWKNGVFTSLPSDCFGVRSIFVSGTDVYTGGVENTTFSPKYWKNSTGVSLPMTPTHNGGAANSIFVSGTDIYASGDDQVNGSHSVPRLWKNAVSQTLNFSFGGSSFGVFVSGTDVYVAGYQWSTATGGNFIATYWKNGVPVALTDGSKNGFAYGIFVSGPDVYAVGADGGTPMYWKNGTPVTLNVPNTSFSGEARSIYVTGTDVYVSGTYRNLAKYWKNGTLFDLTTTTPSGSTFESAVSITGLGADIYIAGNDAGKGYGYWKNGTFQVLSGASLVSGITVK